MSIRYDIRLTLTVPREDDSPLTDYDTQKERTRLEKMIIKRLSKLDGDIDCEVMAVTELYE